MSNRKLIRPSLAEIKEQLTVRQPRNRRPAPSDQTNAENFYYVKQMQNKTPMVVVLQDGETIKGVIDWYDKNSRSEEHTSELQSPDQLVCRLLLEKKKRGWTGPRLARLARSPSRGPRDTASRGGPGRPAA